MRLTDDWVAVSLGTSDTLMFWMKEAKIILDGHILCNPIDPEAYMGLLWQVLLIVIKTAYTLSEFSS